MPALSLFLLGSFGALWQPASARAGTVALWLFDEPTEAGPGSVLKDRGPLGQSLILGHGAQLAPGRFGHALRPTSSAPTLASRTLPPLSRDHARFAALSSREAAALRTAPFANVTGTKLNLGAGVWTVECWLRLDPGATDEGVILELGSGPRGGNELVTRLCVLPRENAFSLSGLGPVVDAPGAPVARRVEYANPEGPPGGAASLFTATLASDRPLPRDTWVHAAVVHTPTDELHLYLGGQLVATAPAQIIPLPHGDDAYLIIGCDGLGQRPFPGMIDELRVSDHTVYNQGFTPPASFARLAGGLRPNSFAGNPVRLVARNAEAFRPAARGVPGPPAVPITTEDTSGYRTHFE